MRRKLEFNIPIFAMVPVVVLLLLAAGCAPAVTAAQANPTAVVVDTAPDRAKTASEPAETLPAAPQPAASPIQPDPQGFAILESRCTQCHLAQQLLETEKSRLEWEKTLARMKANGVRLSEDEKGLLLEFLAAAGKP